MKMLHLLVRRFNCMCLLLCCTLPMQAQTGPGGVGNSQSNVLWLNSESLYASESGQVNFWPDVSGNSNHAFAEIMQAPILNRDASWPERSAHFSDDAPGFLSIADHPTLDGMSAMTVFAVIKPSNHSDEQSVISKREGGGGNSEVFAYRLLTEPDGSAAAEVRRQQNKLTASEQLSENDFNIVAFRFDGNSNSRQLKIFRNGSERGRRNTPQTSNVPEVDNDLIIGALNTKAELPFHGHIAEIIQYNAALKEAEMVIVENYLAAKYQLPSESNYTTGLGSYRHDVSGIGRDRGQDRHDVSQGCAALRGSVAGGMGAGRYVFWGHNGAPAGEVTTDSLPPGIEKRLTRTWKFVLERNINDMHIAFHLDSLAGNDPIALRLLVGRNGEHFLSQTSALPGVVNGDYIEFRNVNLSEGMLVTVGTSDIGIAPLPVELLQFNVENQTDVAAISWATASETNNDFYTILRSADPSSAWETILTKEGTGNSVTRTDYRVYDENPLSGVSYYRLAQTDFDGTYEEFEIKSLSRQLQPKDFGIELFPNPASDVVYIYSDLSLQGVKTAVYDMQGGEMQVNIEQDDTHALIDVAGLPVGVYIFRCAFERGLISMPFVVSR